MPPPSDPPTRRRPLLLCLLCGLPGSGKTSFAHDLCAGLNQEVAWECARITYDDIITQDAFQHSASSLASLEETPEHLKRAEPEYRIGGERLSNWKRYRQELLHYVDGFLAAGAGHGPLVAPEDHTDALWKRFVCCLDHQGLLCSGAAEAGSPLGLRCSVAPAPLCIVMDDNFYYQSMRYEVYQLARKHSAGFCQLVLDCPMESCLQRNRQRKDPLPDEIIRLMSTKMERPNPDKNAWEQTSLTLALSECTWNNSRVMGLLQLALESPVKYLPEDTEQKEADRVISASNFVHQADQALRRIVSQTMQMAKGKVSACKRKVLAEELHHLKGDFLEELRQRSMAGPCTPLHLNDPIAVFQDRVGTIVLRHTDISTGNTNT